MKRPDILEEYRHGPDKSLLDQYVDDLEKYIDYLEKELRINQDWVEYIKKTDKLL